MVKRFLEWPMRSVRQEQDCEERAPLTISRESRIIVGRAERPVQEAGLSVG